VNGELPIDIWYWLLAVSPLILLLVLLVWARWSAPEAGPIGLLLAVALAMIAFEAPLETVAVAAGKGVWDAIFILLVVWPALLLYQVTKEARGFESIRLGIQEHSRNRLYLVLAFGWVFASFLQGIAGFGAPIAIVAPLLVGLGVRPVMAVVIPLVGHAWANLFGTLAVAWLATVRVVEIENVDLTMLLAAFQLWIPNLFAGLMICWLFARWHGVKEGLPLVLVISLIHGGGQAALTQVNPSLSNFIPTAVALGVVVLFTRWEKYKERIVEESPVLTDEAEQEEEGAEEPPMGLHRALFPYYMLTALSVLALGIPPVTQWLEGLEVGFSFPEVTTGYGITNEAEAPYSPIALLTHPGIFLFAAALIGYAWFRAKSEYEGRVIGRIAAGTVSSSIPASVAIVAFLALSTVMDHAGLTQVLAQGVADVSPPAVYAAAAVFIGILGSFMTSSNAASNILFAPLQSQTAETLAGLSQAEVLASQTTGGAIGNAIAPANVVLGTGTAGATGQEGAVLRYTLVFALISGGLVGALSLVYFFVF
jgi:lactate permease